MVKDLEDPAWELYDIISDPSETKDLAVSKPEVIKELTGEYERWAKKVGVKKVTTAAKGE
jgi:arylsulfatase